MSNNKAAGTLGGAASGAATGAAVGTLFPGYGTAIGAGIGGLVGGIGGYFSGSAADDQKDAIEGARGQLRNATQQDYARRTADLQRAMAYFAPMQGYMQQRYGMNYPLYTTGGLKGGAPPAVTPAATWFGTPGGK